MPGEPGRYPTMVPCLRLTPLICVTLLLAIGGCQRQSQVRLEARVHGYDFVDEHGKVLASATSLDEIGPTLDHQMVRPKLLDSNLSVQFYHVSRRLKGFQVPNEITCNEIVDTFEAELAERGIHEFEINYDNW